MVGSSVAAPAPLGRFSAGLREGGGRAAGLPLLGAAIRLPAGPVAGLAPLLWGGRMPGEHWAMGDGERAPLEALPLLRLLPPAPPLRPDDARLSRVENVIYAAPAQSLAVAAQIARKAGVTV